MFDIHITASKLMAYFIFFASIYMELVLDTHGSIFINSLWAIVVLITGRHAMLAGKNMFKGGDSYNNGNTNIEDED